MGIGEIIHFGQTHGAGRREDELPSDYANRLVALAVSGGFDPAEGYRQISGLYDTTRSGPKRRQFGEALLRATRGGSSTSLEDSKIVESPPAPMAAPGGQDRVLLQPMDTTSMDTDTEANDDEPEPSEQLDSVPFSEDPAIESPGSLGRGEVGGLRETVEHNPATHGAVMFGLYDEPKPQLTGKAVSIDPLRDYFDAIKQYPLLTPEEEVALAKRMEAGLFAEEILICSVACISVRPSVE